MSSKKRPDNVIGNLPEGQQAELERRLCDARPVQSYEEALAWLRGDGVRVSRSALARWWQHTAQKRLLNRISQGSKQANQIIAQFERNPADSYRALLGMVGQIAMNKAISEDLDAEAPTEFTKLMIAAKKEEQRGEALKLAREKFQFDAARAALARVSSELHHRFGIQRQPFRSSTVTPRIPVGWPRTKSFDAEKLGRSKAINRRLLAPHSSLCLVLNQ